MAQPDGYDPPQQDVILTTGSDFIANPLVYKPGGVETDWPASTHIYRTFPDTSITQWEYTIADERATLTVDKAVADTVPEGTRAELRYVNGTVDLTLRLGKVQRR